MPDLDGLIEIPFGMGMVSVPRTGKSYLIPVKQLEMAKPPTQECMWTEEEFEDYMENQKAMREASKRVPLCMTSRLYPTTHAILKE